jgi:hypothetical protein
LFFKIVSQDAKDEKRSEAPVQKGYFSSAWPFNLLLHVFFNCLSHIWHPLMWLQADWEQATELPTSDGRNVIEVWWQQNVKGGHEATHNLWRLKCRDKFLPTWDISHFVV